MLDMGYLEGCSTAYVTRWRKKHGAESRLTDLNKALHYLDKLIEVYDIYDIHRPYDNDRVQQEVEKFALANQLTSTERDYIYFLCSYNNREDLKEARETLLCIIVAEESRIATRIKCEPTGPGTPEDGGHYDQK
jgi:hypothetical protein